LATSGDRNLAIDIGDGGVPKRVRADVSRNAGHLRDPGNHAVGVAAIDRSARQRPEDEGSGGAFPAARFEDAQDGDGEGHGGGLVALSDQVQHAVAAQGLAVVLNPADGCFRGTERIDAQQVGECTVVDADGLGDWRKRISSSRSKPWVLDS
jgi:hypothetical protein